MLLGIDAVSALASFGLERFDFVAGLLHRSGHEPAHGMPLPPHLLHDLGQRSAALPLQHRHDPGRLAALARRAALRFRRFGGFCGLRAFA